MNLVFYISEDGSEIDFIWDFTEQLTLPYAELKNIYICICIFGETLSSNAYVGQHQLLADITTLSLSPKNKQSISNLSRYQCFIRARKSKRQQLMFASSPGALNMLEKLPATRVTRRLKFSCVSLHNDNKIVLNLENSKLLSTRHLNFTYKRGCGQNLNWGRGAYSCIWFQQKWIGLNTNIWIRSDDSFQTEKFAKSARKNVLFTKSYQTRANNNNMASRPKRTLHKVRRFVDEFVVSDVKESVKKRPKKDNSLYEVQIKEVDRQSKRIRIHFKGYDARFDEWRPYDQEGKYFPFARWEKPHVLTNSSIELTTFLTCYSYKKEFEFKANLLIS